MFSITNMIDDVTRDIEKRNTRRRMFGDPDRYYLEDLIGVFKQNLQVLDPSYEEYETLLKAVIVLNDKKQKFDEEVRIRKIEEAMRERKDNDIELLKQEWLAYTNIELS